MPYQVLGYGYTWWRGDPLPALPPLPGLRAAPATDYQLLADLAHLDPARILERMQQGNQPYVAAVRGVPVAYGWSASHQVIVEGFGMVQPLPPQERYLWDFATLPQWRGQGIYPRLLQAILAYEEAQASRFWIGHDADNIASGRGILKAGFQLIARLVMTPAGSLKVILAGPPERALDNPFGKYFGFVQAGDARPEQG